MIFDYIKLAFAEIKANKLEVFLTTMGIIVGIAAVTMILAIGEGVTNMIKNQIAVYRENVAFISYSPDKQKSDTAQSAFGDISGNPLAGLMNLIKSASDAKRLEKDRQWALPFDIATKLTGRDFSISTLRVKKLFVWETRFESEKLKQTGFQTPLSVRDGLRRMVEWYEQGGKNLPIKWRQPPSTIQEFKS